MKFLLLSSLRSFSILTLGVLQLSLAPSARSAQQSAPFRVAIVFDKGGKDDKSFNAAAYEGIEKAKEKLKIDFKYVEASDDLAFEPILRSFSQKEFDLIIGVGISQLEALNKVARLFPNRKYAIIDAEIKLQNVRSLLFQEHEGSYLMGAIAASQSQSGKIGFVGGMDIPLIRRFELGFKSGAQRIKPKIEMFSHYVGVTGDAWNNPPKAKELALSQYSRGVDIIFSAAGASNLGVFDAAEEKKKFAIGVDSNQNWIKPGFILTSMLKRVDTAVFQACEDLVLGKFTGGIFRYGISNQGVDYVIDQYNEKLIPAELRKTLDQIKTDISQNRLVVPDYYKKN